MGLGQSGAPTGYKISWKYSGYGSSDSEFIEEYTVDVDDHGNITAIYDDKGTLVREFEYELVTDPSKNARRMASMKPSRTTLPS